VGKSQGRHRAPRTKKRVPIAGAAALAAAGAAVLGLTPTLQASPELAASTYYLRGTNIGDEPTDAEFRAFMARVFDGTDETEPSPVEIEYNAGFWPVSHGGLDDLTYDASVEQGVDHLALKNPQNGDVVFAFSQGAVAASKYKAANENTGATYILVENPSRPNGGVMTRFEGLTIPILDITFSGPTPENGDKTIDIARQYDGWADFPVYPLNFLATANALLGIVYVHGRTQRVEDLTTQIENIETGPGADPMYYQPAKPGANTEYYLIPTERLPLLMPFESIGVPDQILDAVDPPLRYLVELGYDRTDYSKPTGVGLFPALNPVEVATGFADAVSEGVAIGTGSTTTSTMLVNSEERKGISALMDRKPAALTFEAPKFEAPKLPDALKSLKPPTRAPRAVPDPATERTTAPRAIQKALKALAPKKDTAEPGAARKKFSLDRHAAKRAANKAEPAKS
jgi:hypothetical protein